MILSTAEIDSESKYVALERANGSAPARVIEMFEIAF